MQNQSWKREVRPTIDIYLDVKTGKYQVQPYTEGPVATTAFGEPTVITAEDFDLKIADAVLANLEKFGKEKFDQRRAIVRNASEQKQFLKQHLGISIEKAALGGLLIRPLHHEGGGFVGLDEDAITLSEGDLPYKLADVVAEAFKRAT